MTEKRARMDRFAGRLRPAVHHLCNADACGDRETRCHSFADAEQIRRDACMVACEPAACPPESRVDLVGDERRRRRRADTPDLAQPLDRCGPDAAAALDRFDDDRADLGALGSAEQLFNCAGRCAPIGLAWVLKPSREPAELTPKR